MNNQPIYVRTGRGADILLIVLLCVAMVFILFPSVSPFKFGVYIKPPLAKWAVRGFPAQVEGFNWTKADMGNGISFNMATNLYRQKNGAVIIYLTNSAENDVQLLCEIKDGKTGRILAKSGRIAPGFYVEKLKPKWGWKNEAVDVVVSIYALDSEDGYSRGTLEFETVLQAW